MLQQNPKKPSFFRRLSSNSGSTSPKTLSGPTPSRTRTGIRVISDPLSKVESIGIAGPAYEILPVNPTSFPGGGNSKIVRQDSSKDLFSEASRLVNSSPGGLSPSPRPASTPSRHRNPIHPVLASPPKPPVHSMISSSHDGVISQKARENTNGDRYEEVAVTAQRGRRSLGPASISIPPRPLYQSSEPTQSTVSPIKSPARPRIQNASHAGSRISPITSSPIVPRRALDSRGSTSETQKGRSALPTTPAGPTPTAFGSPTSPIVPSNSGMSEAKAYATAVTSSLVPNPARVPAEDARQRPLPQPPILPKSASRSSVHVIKSSTKQEKSSSMKTKDDRNDPLRPAASVSRSSFVPTDKPISNVPKPIQRHSLEHVPKQVSTQAIHLLRKAQPYGQRQSVCLAFVLGHIQVQNALLPWLSINSFLSLTGSADVIRKRFSGETVGRWVLKQWGITFAKEKGRSWPNLTVWEGFLESLLHDPASYSTYPPQWHSLLQHLSLSHTLIVLHLRSFPDAIFPYAAPLPFEDDPAIPYSDSMASLSSLNVRSRLGSMVSDAGSIGPAKMPRQERVMEVIMPEPLAAQPHERQPIEVSSPKPRRRGSISSLASVASSFGRRRAAHVAHTEVLADSAAAAPMAASGKASLPPVSYPTAKRYGFTRHGDPSTPRSRTSTDSGRPGSVFSMQSTPSVISQQRWTSRHSTAGDRINRMMANPTNRASFASSDGRSSAYGTQSPSDPRGTRAEPLFDRPPPYVQGRAPVLRVFVPLSNQMRHWPSADGAIAVIRELDKSGASRRLKLGDLVVNTAIRQPKTTEHVLVFVPFVKHLLVPLEYTHSVMGHLPKYINAFVLGPSYFHPFLPAPQIVYLDLSPFAVQITRSLRLAQDRRDLVVSSGAVLSAKRYIHVAGFEVRMGDKAAREWFGMVSIEAEGTSEGKREIEKRASGYQGPWEVNREKSMEGMITLRLIKEDI